MRVPSPYFNSIKVRLELRFSKNLTASTKFQFHKGTIRTGDQIIVKYIIHEFQFHKGTIRTTKRQGAVELKKYFNSIKVRLELIRDQADAFRP